VILTEGGCFQEQKFLKSAKAKEDDQLAREFHQIREQRIHKTGATMEVLVYGVQKVTTTKCRQYLVAQDRT